MFHKHSKKPRPKKWRAQKQCVLLLTSRIFSHVPLFNHQNTLKKGIDVLSMCFQDITYSPVFNKKPLKIGIQGNNQHFFPWHLEDQNLKKKCFKNRPITKFGMPKKNDAYFSSKNKSIISAIHIFNHFLT